MNRTRLETVRDAVGRLDAPPAPAEAGNNELVTYETRLTTYPEKVSPIDTLDMNTYHSELETPGDCRTLGCIAGVTVCLYPDEAREIGGIEDEETGLRPGVGEIAQRILELSDTESWALFHSEPRQPGGCRITPEEATTAIDRLLAGENPEDIWNHTRSH